MLIKKLYNCIGAGLNRKETSTLVGQYKGNTITIQTTSWNGKVKEKIASISGKDFMKHIVRPIKCGNKLDVRG